MYYKKIKTGTTIIEFHSNLLGVETVTINGQVVSTKSSIWGTDHPFLLTEDGQKVHYILTSKVNGNTMQAYLDLRREGIIIQEDVAINFGMKPRVPKNEFKRSGMEKVINYEIEAGISELSKALKVDATDPEIYFFLACGYSIQEKAWKGFESIRKAVENNLQNTEMILNHHMLAFLRMQEGFEEFLDSNFAEYDVTKLSKEKEE